MSNYFFILEDYFLFSKTQYLNTQTHIYSIFKFPVLIEFKALIFVKIYHFQALPNLTKKTPKN